jgi:Uri superfamily endonuclease
VLALWLGTAQRIVIGRLGKIEFPAGWYCYVGSALGRGGLRARVARHQRRLAAGKRAHWHIDYFREWATWAGAWGQPGPDRLECAWAARLQGVAGAEIVAPGFGASDCRCPAHLVRMPTLPDEAWVARVLGAERIVVGNAEVQELVHALTEGDDDSREAAALALGRFGQAAIESLVALLDRDDADVRWWATRALAEVGAEGGILSLVRVLSDADPDVRACAALALGRSGAGQAAPALAACLADESAFVASVAADALSMLGEPAIKAIAGMLTADEAYVRLLAVRTLARIKSQDAVGPLLGRLEDSSYLVRYYAQEALEALGVGFVFVAP